jgi:hypothetical protein
MRLQQAVLWWCDLGQNRVAIDPMECFCYGYDLKDDLELGQCISLVVCLAAATAPDGAPSLRPATTFPLRSQRLAPARHERA